ncbi:MAG: hypothetical protein AAF548_02520 [Actinomycetota bacterium]
MRSADFAELIEFEPTGKTRRELEAVVERCGRVTSIVAAAKYSALAAIAALGDDGVTSADTDRVKTRSSCQAAKRAAATAEQVTQMPGFQGALSAGEISPEHAEAAAAAAARVTPERADGELERLARQLPADRFAKEAREWASRNEAEEVAASRQEKARREREGRVWQKKNGRVGIYAELDPVAGKPVLKAFEDEMNRLYVEDGGREAESSTVRTYDQRGADALAGMLAGGSDRSRPPHPRYMTHVRVDVDRLTGVDPSGVAAFMDGTPLSQVMLEQIAGDSAFIGSVFGADGAVLWQGRAVRLATNDQWHALIERDGGCRHCGADPSRCRAHHIESWSGPAKGRTDIDNLVLTCDHGHHLIHEKGWRVVIDDDGAYQIVPPG